MIRKFCKTHGITVDQFYGRKVINDSLDLYDILSIPDGGIAQFNPHVDGFLDLERVTKLPDNFSPIVTNWLDIRNVEQLPIGFNPQVGESIFLNSDIICGDLSCEESVKESLKLMIESDDEDIVSLALSMLWKYRTEDIKEITKNKILFKLINY